MFRFLILALALALGTLGWTKAEGIWAQTDPGGFNEYKVAWEQEHVSLPATVFPPYVAASSWSGKLNPSGKVFEHGFRVFYFDRTTSSPRVLERQVNDIAIKYSWSDLHGIPSENFAGYWIGTLSFAEPATRRLSISQGHSKTRLFIDGKLIYEGGESSTFLHRFAAGPHLIEVDHVNQWHTTEFKLTLDEDRQRVPLEGVSVALERLDRRFGGVHYVGLYESNNRDTSVEVSLPDDVRNAVLWLDSYEAIDWRIDRADDIEAVVIASHAPGSRVVNAGSIPVIAVDRQFGLHDIGPSRCHCAGGRFHCENNDSLAELAIRMKQYSGLSMTSFGVSYAANTVTTTTFDEAVRTRISAIDKATQKKRAECEA